MISGQPSSSPDTFEGRVRDKTIELLVTCETIQNLVANAREALLKNVDPALRDIVFHSLEEIGNVLRCSQESIEVLQIGIARANERFSDILKARSSKKC